MLISALCYGVSPALLNQLTSVEFEQRFDVPSGFAALIIFGIIFFKKPVTVSRFDRDVFIVRFFCALSLTVLVESYAFMDVVQRRPLHFRCSSTS